MSEIGNLRVAELDFDEIKENIKNFLRQQSEFTDFDFEGSALSVLIDTLAYNTHYLAFYMNMLSSEAFLDSAALRSSVVSHAKHLNYLPVSRKAPTAIIDIEVNTGIASPANIVIPKNYKFSTTIDNKSYTFVTNETYNIVPVSGQYKLENVVIVQGEWFNMSDVVNNSLPKQRFVIPDPNVDTSTISVRVQTSTTNLEQEVFEYASDFTILTPDSRVFFLQEVENGKYEIYFGDGVLGKKLIDGNIVIVDYLVTDGQDANKAGGGGSAGRFIPSSPLDGFTDIIVTTVTPAFGGAERENIERIRFSAPKNFQTQNRAVTVNDYKTLIRRDYPNASSISVWGGESHVPVTYGKVFISIKPVEGLELTNTTKEFIKKNIISRYNIVSLIPEIVDPEYIYLIIDSTVKYNASKLTIPVGNLRDNTILTIRNFAKENIDAFERIFQYSRLLTSIDNSNVAITSNITKIKMRKEFVPRINEKETYRINFNNPIVPGSLFSNKFLITNDSMINYFPGDEYYFDDDFEGNLRIYKIFESKKVIMKKLSGTINYMTGEVIISNFIPSSVVNGNHIQLTVVPENTDIIPKRNDIITLLNTDIVVKVQPEAPVIV
jgi:hypothetical protein